MSQEPTVEETIAPFEVSITKRYEAGTIKREYRTESWVENPESIPVLITYTDQHPLYVESGGDRRYDRSNREQTVAFGSHATHDPFFWKHPIYGATFHLFTKKDGTKMRKMISERESKNLLNHAEDGKEFDATTWEEDIQALFVKLPKEVRDVVGL